MTPHPLAAAAVWLPILAGTGVTAASVWLGLVSAHPAPWLLAGVAFGTLLDFLSPVLGRHFGGSPQLFGFTRLTYILLPFGIVFTPLCAAFVIAAVRPDGLNADMAAYYPVLLAGSLLFGLLFAGARYRRSGGGGVTVYVLDREHAYTVFILRARRILLALSGLIAVVVMVEGWGGDYSGWARAFGALFLATVPLHILRLHLPSSLTEAATLVVLLWGYWRVFAGG